MRSNLAKALVPFILTVLAVVIGVWEGSHAAPRNTGNCTLIACKNKNGSGGPCTGGGQCQYNNSTVSFKTCDLQNQQGCNMISLTATCNGTCSNDGSQCSWSVNQCN